MEVWSDNILSFNRLQYIVFVHSSISSEISLRFHGALLRDLDFLKNDS